MIDEVRLTFGALREVPLVGELSVRELPGGPEGTLLGLDGDRRPHLLIRAPFAPQGTVETAALRVAGNQLQVGSATSHFVDVLCRLPGLDEVFDHFTVAVIERVRRTPDEPMDAVLAVVERWRRFMIDSQGGVGSDRLASVLGELLVLRDIVGADPGRRSDVWVGPHNRRHDFRRGPVALEVKTTRAHTARVVTIHGEDQLLEPPGGSLHLHLVRLEDVPDGATSVRLVVDDLLALGVDAAGLFDALDAAHVPVASLDREASSTRFEVRERITLPIDDTTPRIVPASFGGGRVPEGIVDLTYRLDLDHALERALDPEAYGRVIAALATGSA